MKMRKIRYVQLGLILAFTLIVGTCLPPFISRIQERSLLDQEAVEEAEVVSVSRTERMEKKEPMEKFLFLLQPGVEYIEYAAGAGASRNADMARDQLEMELELLWEQGMLAGSGVDIDVYKRQLHSLTLVQSLEAFHVQTGVVNEYIVSFLITDEAVTLLVVEPLNCTFHYANTSTNKYNSCVQRHNLRISHQGINVNSEV